MRSARYVSVEDTTWPVDVEPSAQWVLRYGGQTDLNRMRYFAASVLSAYAHLTDPDITQADAVAALKRARSAARAARDAS